MKIRKAILFGIIFLIGFLSANIFNMYLNHEFEVPFSFDNFLGNAHAPSDFVKENQIYIYQDKVVIYIKNASISKYAPTGSMKPLLDKNSNGIRIVPNSVDDIHIGDIISFKKEGYLIVHRVVDKGIDKDGIYFITKGDNNNVSDGKIRFNEIKYKTIGILW